jgi:PAS domain-containing protein
MAETPNGTSSLAELAFLRSQLGQVRRQIDQFKWREEVTRQEEERLQAVLMNMPVMIDAFDSDWNIVLWNRECERVTG